METQEILAEAVAVESAQGMERRRSRRFPCDGAAEGLLRQPDILFRGEVRDMSLTGCLVSTRAELRVRVKARVELHFLVNNNHYRTYARIVDVRRGQGVGMEFLHEDAHTEAAFRGLIHTLQQMLPQAPAAIVTAQVGVRSSK
jgi:hypothetical protein